MKFWNKHPESRKHWFKVQISGHFNAPVYVYNVGYRIPENSLKLWCQRQPGGKFYNAWASDVWYFEREQDASWFLLKWS